MKNNCDSIFGIVSERGNIARRTLKHNNLAVHPQWNRSRKSRGCKIKNMAVLANHIIGGNVILFLGELCVYNGT